MALARQPVLAISTQKHRIEHARLVTQHARLVQMEPPQDAPLVQVVGI